MVEDKQNGVFYADFAENDIKRKISKDVPEKEMSKKVKSSKNCKNSELESNLIQLLI